MSADAAYLDSSAFVKTALAEPETDALQRFLAAWPRLTSSVLLRIESLRAISRSDPSALGRARFRLEEIMLLPLNPAVVEAAATVAPAALRSLDAIHLATAQLLGSDLGVFITYDARLAEGARALGMQVAAPA
jgi:hypothetical protein